MRLSLNITIESTGSAMVRELGNVGMAAMTADPPAPAAPARASSLVSIATSALGSLLGTLMAPPAAPCSSAAGAARWAPPAAAPEVYKCPSCGATSHGESDAIRHYFAHVGPPPAPAAPGSTVP